MEVSADDLERRIAAIEERNARVEADKAWETSKMRIGTLGVTVYGVATILLLSIGDARPLLDAIIPAAGFILSVQSLPLLKRWWIAKWRKGTIR